MSNGLALGMGTGRCRPDGDGGDVSPCRGCRYHFETGEMVDLPVMPRGGCGFSGDCGRLDTYRAAVVRGAHAGRYSVGGAEYTRPALREKRPAKPNYGGTKRKSDLDTEAVVMGHADRVAWAVAIYRETRDPQEICSRMGITYQTAMVYLRRAKEPLENEPSRRMSVRLDGEAKAAGYMDRKDRAHRLIDDDGRTIQSVADEIGVSVSTIKRWRACWRKQ